jgi:hypothetical protein
MPSKSRYGIHIVLCVIVGFGRELNENCALLDYNAASSGNSLPTFRDNISIASSSTSMGRELLCHGQRDESLCGFVTLEDGIGFSEKSIRNYHNAQCNSQEERSPHTLHSFHALVTQELVSSW